MKGENPPSFGCKQLGMLRSCSLTPSCPRSRGLWENPTLGWLGKKEQAEEQALKG